MHSSLRRACRSFCFLFGAFAGLGLAAQERSLDWVLERYVQSMGGRAQLNAINSVSISGTMVLPDGREATLKVMKKRPNLVRTAVLMPPGIRLVNGYDGTVAWKQTITPSMNVVEELNVGPYHAFIRDAALESPLAAEGFDKNQISYEGLTRIEGGIECYHLVIRYPNGTFVEHFLDTATFYERKTVKHEVSEDKVVVSSSFPSDFRFVEGVVFAFRVVIRNPDGSRTEIRIDEVRINPGVLNSLFRKPDPENERFPEDSPPEGVPS
jgi:outer membrane lipoprotein-sorting protein